MKCPRCDNEDPAYFYTGHKGIYCRKCVGFKRILLEEELEAFDYEVNKDSDDFFLPFELSSYQKAVSKKVKEIIETKDVLLYCVCGAGKTELVVEAISKALNKGKKVCYAISRKEVVKELEKRFRNIFYSANVVAVYGGHSKKTVGDLILATTHQLYRYHRAFDLLILDEVDAFPLKGNDTLMHIALNSCKGHVIYSTATVNEFLKGYLDKQEYEKVELMFRPTLKPLIVPKIIFAPSVVQYLILLFLMSTKEVQCIIFVPSKRICRFLYYLTRYFFSVTYAYSSLAERDENIEQFRNRQYQFIISTSILERGTTFKDIDIIIFDVLKGIFDEAAYTQMTGRVGRNAQNPYGVAHVLTSHLSKELFSSKKNIERANHELSLLQ